MDDTLRLTLLAALVGGVMTCAAMVLSYIAAAIIVGISDINKKKEKDGK